MNAAEQPSSTQNQPYHGEQDALDSSISLVREYASRIEQNYARPALNSSYALYEARPALAIFIAIFSSLSLIPVISFLGVCIFVVVSFTAIAVGCAFATISVVLLGLSSIIIPVLFVTLLASLFLTTTIISTYMLFRLAILIRQDGSSGVSNWAGEAKQHFYDHTRRGGRQNRDLDTLSEKPADPSYSSDLRTKAQD